MQASQTAFASVEDADRHAKTETLLNPTTRRTSANAPQRFMRRRWRVAPW